MVNINYLTIHQFNDNPKRLFPCLAMILSLPIAKHRANLMVFNRFSKFSRKIYMDTMANEKKTRLLDLSGTQLEVLWYGPRSSAPSLSSRLSCSASNHDISRKLKHVACFTCSLLLWIQLLSNKFNDWKT